jgi:hypothetical protein
MACSKKLILTFGAWSTSNGLTSGMRKTYALVDKDQHADRLSDRIKHDIRKYFNRQRNKTLPKGSDHWLFDCKIGPDEALAQGIHPKEINAKINEFRLQELPSFFIEILTRAAKRPPKPEHHPDQVLEQTLTEHQSD